jgi:Tfp pilus assembly protein PilO
MSLLQGVPPPTMPPIPVDPNVLFMDPKSIVMIVLLVTVAVTIVAWPIVRALARRLEAKAGLTPSVQGELDQMHHRLAELDTLQQRVVELEERLDFAERLLARGDTQATLPRSTP